MILNILIILFILIMFLIIKFNLSLGTISNRYQKTKHIVIWYDIKGYQYKRREYIYLFTIKVKV